MNTSIQHPELNGIVQPSGDLSQSEATLSVLRNSPGRFTFAALLAGLLFLLFSAPSAPAPIIPPGCLGSGLGIQLFTSAPDVHIGDTICYSVTVFNGTGVGPIVCDAEAIQAFVVTPDGVTHPIALVRTYLSNGQSDYYPNVVCYVVRAQDVRSDGTVRATANDTGIIHQNETDSTGGGFQASVIAVVQTPGAPTLFISHSGNTVTVYWQNVSGWNLQQNSNLTVPADWSASGGVTLSNGTNYLNLANPEGNLFFRLKQ